MRTACLIAILAVAPLGAPAAELPRGDCKRPAARTDLSARDLSGAKFAGKDLRGARFAGAKMENADFRKARLDNADFGGANAKWANFSKASTDTNEENMVVIRGSTRVADIYLGEFMRSYSHYAFREAVAIARMNGNKAWKPQFLEPTDKWQRDYFKNGSSRYIRRTYFAGT